MLLIFSVLFLAYTNGANDNFKGVATLLGSRTTSYRRALTWATMTTFMGSLTAVLLSGALIRAFSGKGLVPTDVLTTTFLTAVGLGAAATVLIATRFGFPISTTHGLVGALVGAGIAAEYTSVRVDMLGKAFLAPLLVSPLLATVLAAGFYPLFRWLRLRLKVERETCVCIDTTTEAVPQHALGFKTTDVSLSIDSTEACEVRYSGRMLGLSAQKILDNLHFVSAGAVCFARGLNDTPKIVALLAGAHFLSVTWGSLIVGGSMAVGGLVSARRVAETMSYRITEMNHGQGFTANLVTTLVVLGASRVGIPVSTTHVSCGTLFGMGGITQQAHWQTVGRIALSWVITLLIAAALSGIIFFFLN